MSNERCRFERPRSFTGAQAESDMEEDVTRFLLGFLIAVIRNCGVAIAISVFFAAAQGPAHPNLSGAVDALAAAQARFPAQPAQAPRCERPPGPVCRLVDAGQRASPEPQ
jgi:hypothetical protein